jgi:hypothetical protein
MDDAGIDAVSSVSSGSAYSSLAGASNDPSQNSVQAWTDAMSAASSNRSAAEQSQSNGANAPAAEKTEAPGHNGGGSWVDRALGVLQAGVGVVETVGGVVGGVLTAETGVGAVAGGVVALHGLDDIQAGVRQAWTGKPTETFTQQAVTSGAQHAGMSPQAAAALGIGVDIVAGGGVGGGEKAAVKGTEEAVKIGRDLAEADKGAKVAKDELAATRAADRVSEVARAAEPTKGDLDAYRARLGGVQADTIAVGRTNVPGLEKEVLEGASPKVRKEAGLPDLNTTAPDRPIQSPRDNPLFTRHAEEDLANNFVKKVEDAHLKPADLDGKTLNIRISNADGVCTPCMQGLKEGSNAPAGVIKQLSERYPGLTIRIAAEGGDAYAGRTVVEIRNGKIIN